MGSKHIMGNNIQLDKFYNDYISKLSEKLIDINTGNLDKIINLLIKKIKNNKQIFICGNGGSAAIANHYICDYLKLLRYNTKLKPKIISLADNIETITAISNDISYSEVFKYQAESLCNKSDLIIIISSSGNSLNVLNLAKWAKKNKIDVVSFTGFDGGKLKKISKININIYEKNYGRIEDSHHILMHIMMHFISLKYKNVKKIRL